MKFLLLSVFLSICNLIFSQSDSISANNFNIPNDIKECISGLDKVFSQPAKNKFKSLNKDTLGYLYDIFIIDEWLHSDSSRLRKYFINLGISFDYEMEYFICLAYYKYLNTGDYDVESELNCYKAFNDSIDLIKKRECDSLIMSDSINGQYIPNDLFDCYHHLDKLLSDSMKLQIKVSNNLIDFHFSLGRWIRNTMGLWTCSRFKRYFQRNNIKNPDDMSGLIIEGYKCYLNDSIYDIAKLKLLIPPPPPPSLIASVKFKAPYNKKRNNFIKKHRLNDFEISNYASMKIKNCK